MALSNTGPAPDIANRFGIAQDGYIPEDIEQRRNLQIKVRARIYEVATLINENIAQGRELSLALTHLEEALLWAGKAIFKD